MKHSSILPLAVLAGTMLHSTIGSITPMKAPLANEAANNAEAAAAHSYVGLWVTDDGHVRHKLLPGGRYDEARGSRETAYQGRYDITGDHIEYWDDTGFTADGDFVDSDTLHHGGMILRRRS